MYNIIPLVLILISFSIIIYIVIKKFSVLASLDINTIQEEKELQFKEKIIKERLQRKIKKYSSKIFIFLKAIKQKLDKVFRSFYDYLLETKNNYHKEEIISQAKNNKVDIDALFLIVKDYLNKDDLDKAEKKILDIIAIDSSNEKAFMMLGNLYYKKKNYDEAKETFKYVLKLKRKLGQENETAEVYYNLFLIDKVLNNNKEALIKIKKALSIEENNPRYLDAMFEISIINKDKESANLAFNKLKEVNPDNNKLDEMRKRVNEIKE